ncbi:hypothetical protein EYF80_056591 [Liparis tanakae]|uniref:Uncharacterized protein n=1 Tax=Liparis tanakae TaxID=230148 RepID=A0A4Z2EWU2_9TELE|nr:hypothetical protein EYF80_056591 [Liparis tanakae]
MDVYCSARFIPSAHRPTDRRPPAAEARRCFRMKFLRIVLMSSEVESRSSGPQWQQALMTEYLRSQHFRRLPLLHLPVLPLPRGGRPRRPPIGRAQPPQLGRQISTNQHAAGAHVAMDAALTVQVLLDVQVKTGEG